MAFGSAPGSAAGSVLITFSITGLPTSSEKSFLRQKITHFALNSACRQQFPTENAVRSLMYDFDSEGIHKPTRKLISELKNPISEGVSNLFRISQGFSNVYGLKNPNDPKSCQKHFQNTFRRLKNSAQACMQNVNSIQRFLEELYHLQQGRV